MRAALLLTLTLSAATPALAQDAPLPAGDLLAKLLQTARQKGVLQHRLLTKRYYRAEERGGQTFLVTGQGAQTKTGLRFELTADLCVEGREAGLIYRFDAQGRLTGVTLSESRRGKTRETRIEIAGGKTTATRIRDGAPSGKPREGIWTGDRISLFSTIVLLSSLGDLGLPNPTNVLAEHEDDDIGKTRRPRQMVVQRQAAKDGAQVITIDRVRPSGNRPLARVVVGVGKDQGVIREVALDPKPKGPPGMTLKLIDPKDVPALRELIPVIANEARAARALRYVHSAQRNFRGRLRGKNNGYAETLEELAAARLIYDKQLAEGKSPGYMVLVRRSPDKQSWMAVAVPEQPGKTGRYYFAINQAGVVHRSKTPIELQDTCTLPKHAEPLKR